MLSKYITAIYGGLCQIMYYSGGFRALCCILFEYVLFSTDSAIVQPGQKSSEVTGS